MYFYLLIWSTSKCESCLTCGWGPKSELKIPKHFIPEKDLHCYKLIQEIVSIQIISVHLNKEHIRICCWGKKKNKNQSLVSVQLSKQNKKKPGADLQLVQREYGGCTAVVKSCEVFVVLWTLCSNSAPIYIVFKLDMVNNSAIIDLNSVFTELKYRFTAFIYTNLYVITQIDKKVILPRTA